MDKPKIIINEMVSENIIPEVERVACGTEEEFQDLIDMLSTSDKA